MIYLCKKPTKNSKKDLLEDGEFSELLQASKQQFQERAKIDEGIKNNFSGSFQMSDKEISTRELVDLLLEGYKIEDYIKSLPKERQEEKTREVKELFDSKMKQRGISSNLATMLHTSLIQDE